MCNTPNTNTQIGVVRNCIVGLVLCAMVQHHCSHAFVLTEATKKQHNIATDHRVPPPLQNSSCVFYVVSDGGVLGGGFRDFHLHAGLLC